MSTKTQTPAATAKVVTPANNAKPELSNVHVPAPTQDGIQEKKAPTIEEKIKRFLELEKLLERRQVIEEAITNLKDFFIAPTGTGCNLKLQDSNGKTFGISHPSVIGEMVSMAKAKLTDELHKIDEQFSFNI